MSALPGGTSPDGHADVRGVALADYLRSRAATSSGDVDNAGLLEAADIAEALPVGDARLLTLSDAGHFGSSPGGRVLFLETPAVRAEVRRQLASRQPGAVVLEQLVASVTTRATPAPPSLGELSHRVRNARLHVQSLRQGRASTQSLADARRALLLALEAYVEALEQRGFPVPGALHGELELHRKLFF
jgi:hypothetical protein